MLSFVRNSQIIFQSGCTILYYHQQLMRLSVVPHPCQNRVLIAFSNLVILIGVLCFPQSTDSIINLRKKFTPRHSEKPCEKQKLTLRSIPIVISYPFSYHYFFLYYYATGKYRPVFSFPIKQLVDDFLAIDASPAITQEDVLRRCFPLLSSLDFYFGNPIRQLGFSRIYLHVL